MTENIVKIALTVIPPFFGIVIDTLLTRERSKSIQKLLNECKEDLVDQLNYPFESMADHFVSEIDKAMGNLYRDPKTFDIDDLSIRDFKPSLTTVKVSEISKTTSDIKRLELALTRTKIFRWVFWFILFIGGGITLSIVYIPDVMPYWLTFTVMSGSFLFLLLYLLDRVIIHNLLDEVGSHYDI